LLLDGGIRRGRDILKALALGADGVLLGRAALFGVAAGGEAGAARCLQLLQAELLSAMQLCGLAQLPPPGAGWVRGRQEG
jgi:isopentenyl diphosphate isomerase/L-lactate dehydrogenase-like FMN-dependent dehydrogenase